MCGQPANLGIQVLELPLMGCCFGPLLAVIPLEELRQALQDLFFPAMQLGGMHAVLKSHLSDRLLFPQKLEHSLGFLFGGKASSRGR